MRIIAKTAQLDVLNTSKNLNVQSSYLETDSFSKVKIFATQIDVTMPV